METLSEWLRAGRDERRLGLQLCLKRIEEIDPTLHAWVRVRPQPPTGAGPLSDIPVGIKDVIDTEGLPTEYGSLLYRGRKSASDAAIVQKLRRRGAVVLGKTQTAAFACFTPAPTRNPRNPEHTPGGSSSGSAVAVAAGMTPLAIGTQTLGSVVRPASYCGVTGFKPSYGVFSLEGVLPIAKSLDTIGFFTHTAADMLGLWGALGQPRGGEEDLPLGAPEPALEVEPEMESAFQDAVSRLRNAGFSVQPVKIAGLLGELDAASRLVMRFEAAEEQKPRYREHGSRLDSLADLVREGLEISDGEYEEARRFIDRSRKRIAEVYKSTPVILTPAAAGPAPAGLASTGDPKMNSPWTALGGPAVSIPMADRGGLPLGLQITAEQGRDARVLQMAVRIEKALDPKAGGGRRP